MHQCHLRLGALSQTKGVALIICRHGKHLGILCLEFSRFSYQARRVAGLYFVHRQLDRPSRALAALVVQNRQQNFLLSFLGNCFLSRRPPHIYES